jgi:hypothetical protein
MATSALIGIELIMIISQAIQGVFSSPALAAAGWGMGASFLFCIVLVITKRWHGVPGRKCLPRT